VTLTVEDSKGNTDIGNYIVGVQPDNVFEYKSTDKMRKIDPAGYLQAGTSAIIGPNIGGAWIKVKATMYEVVGDCWFNLTIESDISREKTVVYNISSESFSRRGEDANFDYYIHTEELPETVFTHESRVIITATIEQGRWYWAEFSLRGYFPLKYLTPPPM
jgi:hypothetical protein